MVISAIKKAARHLRQSSQNIDQRQSAMWKVMPDAPVRQEEYV